MHLTKVVKLQPGDVVISRARVVAREGEFVVLDFGNGKQGEVYVGNEMFWAAFERYEAPPSPKPATNPGIGQA